MLKLRQISGNQILPNEDLDRLTQTFSEFGHGGIFGLVFALIRMEDKSSENKHTRTCS